MQHGQNNIISVCVEGVNRSRAIGSLKSRAHLHGSSFYSMKFTQQLQVLGLAFCCSQTLTTPMSGQKSSLKGIGASDQTGLLKLLGSV